ncbi:MAG TPA: histidinol dehydrogenase [Gammaproteobacteria bacterium]|nr:histidinol dehydrogenase [Gammaproteobacteria bacterium]
MTATRTLKPRRLRTRDAGFKPALEALLGRETARDDAVDATVRDIINQVRSRGDAALIEYTNRYDRRQLVSAAELEVPRAGLEEARATLNPELRTALESAAGRIRAYHERQRQSSWSYVEADGTVLGQQVTPLDRVGVYVPGGRAAYPSSVLMNVIPARVAGVGEIIMAVPAPDDVLEPVVLAAAAIAGVDRAFTMGGAQAVAALAYGTAVVPRVDKIVGPGNLYVARAKAMVFGAVGIDMIAGPSEILVICDGKTNADWIAMDLFSQAEHDEEAQAILLCPDAGFLDAVEASIRRLLPDQPRATIIRQSLADRGALIEVGDLDEAVEIANHIAAEHLELSVEDPAPLAGKIRHAGAIFLGRHVPEALGDYCAGPNHVLPTGRTARFSSPLGVYDFQKRSSLIQCTPAGAERLGRLAAALARAEGLPAHAASAEYRFKSSE